MPKHIRPTVLIGLAALMVLSLMLSGCGAINAAKQVADVAKELATKAPDIAKEVATRVPQQSEPEPTAEPAEATEVDNAFDNLVKLAPVHLKSSWVSKIGDEVRSEMSYEADIDAKGNQRMTLVSGGEPIEILIVDKTMYMKAEDDQYVSLGEGDAGFDILAAFGGAYLLSFNKLEEATLVGSEAVGPWQAKKYQVNVNLASAGLSGFVAGAQGAKWDYKSFAWIENSQSALVKATVVWSAKGTGDAQTESFHSEFLATPGTVTEIKAPENAASMG